MLISRFSRLVSPAVPETVYKRTRSFSSKPKSIQDAVKDIYKGLAIDPRLKVSDADSIVGNRESVSVPDGLRPGTSTRVDWNNLGFKDQSTRAISVWETMVDHENGARGNWQAAGIDPNGLVWYQGFRLNPAAQLLHYGQAWFEGAKVQVDQNGSIYFFRLQENAKRAQQSSQRLLMPDFPITDFMQMVAHTVKANFDYVPRHLQGVSADQQPFLYIRPFMMGVGAQMGVGSSNQFAMCCKVIPMGAYFGPGKPSVSLLASKDFARAAESAGGTGSVKYAGNYSGSMLAGKVAKRLGHAEHIYVRQDGNVDEAGAANVGAITRDGKVLLVDSPSILPSTTRGTLEALIPGYLGMDVDRRPASIEELLACRSVFLMGTAAGVLPVDKIEYEGRNYAFDPDIKALKDLYNQARNGEIEVPSGWRIEMDDLLSPDFRYIKTGEA